MSKLSTNTHSSRAVLELKGSLFALTIVQLYRTELTLIDEQLGAKINQAPGFFQNAPVVVDLAELKPDCKLDFAALIAVLRSRSMIPVGFRNGSEDLQEAAQLAGLPKMPNQRSTKTGGTAEVKQDSSASTDVVKSPSRFHHQPIRSGQQVYAPQGDLIIHGAVSNGAEVLADGHIHIYGTLRGRALAGVKGDETARIFCSSLEAQLISIAGIYRVFDEPDQTYKSKPVQIFLDDDKLVIELQGR